MNSLSSMHRNLTVANTRFYNINNSNLINYYPFDTNLSDFRTGSAVSNVTTIGGAAIVAGTTKLTSGSLYLNSASSQAVQIPNITVAAGGFSVAFWVKYISGSFWVRFFDFGSGQAANNIVMGVTTAVSFAIFNPSSGTANGGYTSSYTMPTDQNWHHLCLTISSAGAWTLYADGVLYAIPITAYPSTVPLTNCYIGKSNWNGDPYPTMYLNQVLIFNRELTSSEVYTIVNYPNDLSFTSAQSTSIGIPRIGLTFSLDFPSPTIPATDTFGSTLTQNSSVTVASNGTRGYVLYTGPAYSKNSISTNYATPSTFSRTFWVYFTGTGNYADCCIGSANFNILNPTFRNLFSVELNKISGTRVDINTTLIPTNIWRHVAVTYDGTTCRIYMNGSSVTSGTGTYTGETGTLNAGGLCIGDYNNGGFTSNGYYDQIHCYNRALTAAEVLQIYSIENVSNIPNNIQLGLAPNPRNNTAAVNIGNMNVSQNDQYIVLSVYGNGLWTSSNNGNTFTKTGTIVDNYSGVAMSLSGQYVYVCCNNIGRCYYSANYGASWTSVNFGSNISSITCDSNGTNVWATNFGGSIFRSTNFGVSFTSLYTTGVTNIVNISYNSSLNSIYYTSTSNGTGYQFNLTTNTLTNSWKPNSGYTNCSGIAASDNGIYVYLLFFGVSTNQLYYSSDSGSSWTAFTFTMQSGDNASTFSGIFCSPSGQFVYTISFGQNIYYSSNYGVSWNFINYYTRLNNSNIQGISLNSYKNILLAYGSGTTSGYIKA